MTFSEVKKIIKLIGECYNTRLLREPISFNNDIVYHTNSDVDTILDIRKHGWKIVFTSFQVCCESYIYSVTELPRISTPRKETKVLYFPASNQFFAANIPFSNKRCYLSKKKAIQRIKYMLECSHTTTEEVTCALQSWIISDQD